MKKEIKVNIKRKRGRHFRSLGTVLIILIFSITIANVLVPDKTYSSSEKRLLAGFPQITINRILDGSFSEDVETYLSDQFVGRNIWIGMKTGFDRLLGKVESQGVYLGKDGYLIEKTEKPSEQNLKQTIEAMKGFAKQYEEANISFLLVPNVSCIYPELLPTYALTENQNQWIQWIYDYFEDSTIRAIDVREKFTSEKENQLYYKTDHHWTTKGAWTGFEVLAKVMNLDASLVSYEPLLVASQFQGSLCSESGFYGMDADEVFVWKPVNREEQIVVRYEEEQRVSASFYSLEGLKSDDAYTVFLGGNYPSVKITTDANSDRRLLLIKDSYANCLVPFLAPYFEEIYMVDPRYYYGDIFSQMELGVYTDVLFLYNANTFLEDNSLQLIFMEDENGEK